MGTSASYWGHAYIGKAHAHIGVDANCVIGFWGATGTILQRLSTTSNNQGFSGANANNYLYVLNNVVGILDKLGLLSA